MQKYRLHLREDIDPLEAYDALESFREAASENGIENEVFYIDRNRAELVLHSNSNTTKNLLEILKYFWKMENE